eukprot:CFRG0571T1
MTEPKSAKCLHGTDARKHPTARKRSYPNTSNVINCASHDDRKTSSTGSSTTFLHKTKTKLSRFLSASGAKVVVPPLNDWSADSGDSAVATNSIDYQDNVPTISSSPQTNIFTWTGATSPIVLSKHRMLLRRDCPTAIPWFDQNNTVGSPARKSALFRQNSSPNTPSPLCNLIETSDDAQQSISNDTKEHTRDYQFDSKTVRSWSTPLCSQHKPTRRRFSADVSACRPKDWSVELPDGKFACRSLSIEPSLEPCQEIYENECADDSQFKY